MFSAEPQCVTQGLALSRDFINICQMKEELSLSSSMGLGGTPGQQGALAPYLPSSLEPTRVCTAPHRRGSLK